MAAPAVLAGRSAANTANAFGPADAVGSRYAVATILDHYAAFPDWQAPLAMMLRYMGSVDVVGIERPAGQAAQR